MNKKFEKINCREKAQSSAIEYSQVITYVYQFCKLKGDYCFVSGLLDNSKAGKM